MKILFSSVLLFAAFAFAQNIDSVDDGSLDHKQIWISILEQDKANELFKQFVQNKEIPFKYPVDGCFARAQVMAQMAEKENILMGKVFAEGNLQVKTNYQKYPIAHWGWHVAPVAYVRKPNKQIEIMVFDPTLFEKPVPLEEWKQKMMDTSNGNKPEIKTYYAERFQYKPVPSREHWEPDDLNDAKTTLKKYQPLQDLASSTTSKSGGNLPQQVEGVR